MLLLYSYKKKVITKNLIEGVMVFMYQLEWAKGYPNSWKVISGCVSERD